MGVHSQATFLNNKTLLGDDGRPYTMRKISPNQATASSKIPVLSPSSTRSPMATNSMAIRSSNSLCVAPKAAGTPTSQENKNSPGDEGDIASRSAIPRRLPRTKRVSGHMNKPLPSPPSLTLLPSSPLVAAHTLYDATEKAYRALTGMPEDQTASPLSTEEYSTKDCRKSAMVKSDKDADSGSVFGGPNEALLTLTSSETNSTNKVSPSPPRMGRAVYGQMHRATLVNSNLRTRQSIHSPAVSPRKAPSTPTKNRRRSDPGTPSSSPAASSLQHRMHKTGDRVVHLKEREHGYGPTMLIRKEADRIIFGPTSRKPTFSQLCDVKGHNNSHKASSASTSRRLTQKTAFDPFEKTVNENEPDLNTSVADKSDFMAARRAIPSIVKVDNKKVGESSTIAAPSSEHQGKEEADGVREQPQESPSKSSIHQRTPTPDTNTYFGRAQQQHESLNCSPPNMIAPWLAREPQKTTSDSGPHYPPRSDSLCRIAAQEDSLVFTTDATSRTDAPKSSGDSPDTLQTPGTSKITKWKNAHVSVAESSFEAIVSKAKHAQARSHASKATTSTPSVKQSAIEKTDAVSPQRFAPSNSISSLPSLYVDRLTRRDTKVENGGFHAAARNPLVRSHSKGRKVMSNIKGLFHRRQQEMMDKPLPTEQSPPARAYKSAVPQKMETPPQLMGRKPSSPAQCSPNSLPKHRDRPTPPFGNTISNRYIRSPPGAYSNNSPDTLTRTTSTAMALLHEAQHGQHRPDRKEELVSLAQVMIDAITNAKEAEKAMYKAQQAAKEAAMACELTRAAIVEIRKLCERRVESLGIELNLKV